MIEHTLVLLKPDAVKRGIIGEILLRFERAGLKISAAKLVNVTKEFGAKHYCHDEEWQIKVGERNIKECLDGGLDAMKVFGTRAAKEIGLLIDKRNAEFLASGPVFAFVLEGVNAVSKVRSIVGSTFPATALPGTIRGDFGIDSAYSGMKRQRTTYNIIHASGNLEEAESEIALWFKPGEILSYKRIHEDLYNY